MSQDQTPATTSGIPLGEISQAPPALEVFLDKHQTKLIAFGILLAIGAAAYVVFDGIKTSGEENAGDLLVKAEEISDYQSVVKNHEGTAAAFSAKVLLADKLWADGQQEEAVSTLRAFLAAGGDHPALPGAKASLASMLLSQGKTDEAASLFREIADDPQNRHLAPYAWIAVGDIEAAKGNRDAALKAYETVGTEFDGSPFQQDAEQRILLLKAKAPEEIAAAPVVVPDTNLTGDEPAEGEAPKAPDLIDALEGGAGDAAPNPLLDAEKESE